MKKNRISILMLVLLCLSACVGGCNEKQLDDSEQGGNDRISESISVLIENQSFVISTDSYLHKQNNSSNHSLTFTEIVPVEDFEYPIDFYDVTLIPSKF